MTVTHGLSRKHPLYERWKGMRARCNNPGHDSFHRYGGRGICVCGRWDDFTTFVEDMGASWPGPGHELHRVDNEGDYSPKNCVWVSTDAHRALPKSPEHRANIGAAHRGRKHSPEHCAAAGDGRRIALDVAWLREAYVGRGLSVYVIAMEAGCGKSSVHRALQRAGISRGGE